MKQSVQHIIEKWYRELNFPQKFDDEFYAALQNVEINEDSTIENFDLEEENGKKSLLSCLFFCEAIKKKYEERGRIPLTVKEVEAIVIELAENPMQKPYLNDARTKMASRDYSFRDAYHGNIQEYLKAVTPEEFERFIGSQSIEFDKILEENKDVLKRLKQSEDE